MLILKLNMLIFNFYCLLLCLKYDHNRQQQHIQLIALYTYIFQKQNFLFIFIFASNHQLSNDCINKTKKKT